MTKSKDLAAAISESNIIFIDREEKAEQSPWNPHPKFPGVHLKHLIKGADSNGGLSCYIVRVDANCMLDSHINESQWELHEVIAGEGKLYLESKEKAYYPGCMGVIPRKANHKVVARGNGMVLLAKFFPAMM